MKHKLIVALSILLCLSGCSTKPDEKPVDKTEEHQEESIKTMEIDGMIEDITSTRIIIKAPKETISMNREKADISGDLIVGNKAHVTYKEQDDDRIAIQIQISSETKSDIDEMIFNMTLEEKVGQMFMVRCPTSEALEAIDTYHMGGYILFEETISPYTKDQFITNNEAFQRESKISMLIGVDEEGGSVNRLSWYTNYRSQPFASPQTLYQEGGFNRIIEDTKEKDALLKSLQINVNFAPVSDVSTNPSDFIYPRAFGKDAAQTSEYVKTVINTMKTDQMGSVLKHFPGYGNNQDTHTGSSLDKRSYDNFVKQDFLPFEAGIEAGAGSILVSHNIIIAVDENNPASLSPKLHEILRQDLNFDGVIFTDDLFMDAIRKTRGLEEGAIEAVEAGNDMLIIRNYKVQIPAVLRAVKEGTIKEERINESVKRILLWKKQLGLI